jgi:hypothetical protein
MATSEATARIRANALKALKETGIELAAQLDIEPPQLDFFFKDHDYQQAQELTALAGFNTRLLNALQTQSEGEGDDQSSAKTVSKRRLNRTAVSQR